MAAEIDKRAMSEKLLQCRLLTMRKCKEVNRITGFCEHMRKLDVGQLVDDYHELKSCAPRRHCMKKPDNKYFVGHTGAPSGDRPSNRREEHLAMALCNDFAQKGNAAHADMSKLQFLDYQVPLNAWRNRAGIGEVDLFGVIDNAHPCVIELKIGAANTPLYALLEALAYCAIVEANMADIAKEAQKEFNLNFSAQQPRLMILAPNAYWQKFIGHRKAGNWQPAFLKLLAEIHKRIGVRTHLAALPDDIFSMGSVGVKPRLQCDVCIVKSVPLSNET